MQKSLAMLCFALLASLAAATVAAPAGFAQSAGDEQYVDPFQNDQGSGGGGGDTGSGGGGGGNTGSGGGSDPGAVPEQPSVPEAPTGEAPGDTLGAAPTTGTGSSTSTEGSAAGEFALPRTGLPLLAVLGAGLLLLGGGWALRRSA
jgi:hypothetical protein